MKVDTAEFLRAAHQPRDFSCDGTPEIAFVGRSNVGKSSLLNRLLGRKALARTSSTPGRTRAVNYFLVNSRLLFVDLPGFGYARASKRDRAVWARLVESYFEQPEHPVHVVQLIDAKVGVTPLDLQAFDFLSSLGHRPALVATKADRVPRSRRAAALAAIRAALPLEPDEAPIAFSARTGEGTAQLWSHITRFLTESSERPT